MYVCFDAGGRERGAGAAPRRAFGEVVPAAAHLAHGSSRSCLFFSLFVCARFHNRIVVSMMTSGVFAVIDCRKKIKTACVVYVQELLTARVAALGEEEAALCKLASVFGFVVCCLLLLLLLGFAHSSLFSIMQSSRVRPGHALPIATGLSDHASYSPFAHPAFVHGRPSKNQHRHLLRPVQPTHSVHRSRPASPLSRLSWRTCVSTKSSTGESGRLASTFCCCCLCP